MTTPEPQFLYLTTTGWKTSKQHEIEIWFVHYGNGYYLVSEHREKSHWVQNIEHQPDITFRVGDETLHGKGRAIDPNKERELAKNVAQLMDAKYEWSDGLIIELMPD